MIEITNLQVMNLENAIRGMRNPLNSWDRMDSFYDEYRNFVLGINDYTLAKKLSNAGSDDRKFLRQILVSVDITAPFYWWKEFDTYKVGTVANSCSTMHTVHKKPFELSDFSWENLLEPGLQLLELTIDFLNKNRELYLETKDKIYWHQMIQILPTSYNQMRTVTLNYEVLKNMHHARKHHKLDEWRFFCSKIEDMPYSCLITGE